MKDLSVILVNWNTREYLLRCLRSLLEPGKGDFLEILVIDNGSSDGSASEVKKTFRNIRVIENSENLGFAKATNQGVKASSGRYQLLLNPDTLVKEGTIEVLFTFMDGHPEVGIAGAQLLDADGRKQNSIANFPTLATELLNKSLLRWLFPERFPGKGRTYREPIEVDSVIGACMMVRREAIEEVGWLDEDYFLFLEETDWCYRMKEAGWKIYHVPRAEIYHFQGKSAEGKIEKAKIEYYRSRYRFFRKYRGPFHSILLVIGLTMKLWFEFLLMLFGCMATLFTVKMWRRRFRICATLVWWHVKLCPLEMGLRKGKKG
jgi:GT2 family glycosyltransferase